MDEATYELVSIGNNEVFFQNCFFGGDGAAMSEGTLVEFQGVGAANPPRSVFENCTFLMSADAANPTFLTMSAGLGRGWAIFKNCVFLNAGSALTYGVDGTGLNNFNMYMDHNCAFYGVTDITQDVRDASIIIPNSTVVAAADTTNMHCTFPNHS